MHEELVVNAPCGFWQALKKLTPAYDGFFSKTSVQKSKVCCVSCSDCCMKDSKHIAYLLILLHMLTAHVDQVEGWPVTKPLNSYACP